MILKVMTFNIHKGKSALGLRNTLHALRDFISMTKSDIVFLQEVVGEGKKYFPSTISDSFSSQLEFLADGVWPDFAYGKNAIYTNGHHGNAILSKFPITEWTNLNLTLNKYEQRGQLHALVEIPNDNKKIHLLNVHLNLRHHDRVKQIQKVIDVAIKKIPTHEQIILAGDFNDWNKQLSTHLYNNLNLKEAFKERHGKYAKTFPVRFPFFSLDRIYTRGLAIEEATCLNNQLTNRLSDHIPIQAILRL